MSLKAELETWAAALKAYDEEDFERALDLFSRIADSSKILTNMGLIYATLGEHEAAVEQFQSATQLDQYLAVAYFQCGVSNFLLARYDLSLRDFDEALLYLRGNQDINYEQLGLKFKLFSAEVLFNRGLSRIYLGDVDSGLIDMQDARASKATEEHNVIDDAITDRGEGYTVFSIPVGVLYRPSENKLKNTKSKDYMGKAKLIASENAEEAYTEFTGVARKARGFTGTGAPISSSSSDPSAAQVQFEAGAGLGRSQTVPPPRVTVDDTRPGALMRSRTVLASPAQGQGQGQGPRSPGSNGMGMQRSNTMRPAMGMGMDNRSPMSSQSQQGNGLVRGLSVRNKVPNPNGMGARAQAGSGAAPPPPPPPPPEKESTGAPRLTEIYDDYIVGYGNDDGASAPPLPPPVPAAPFTGQGQGPARVAAWARNNANPGLTPSRAPSMRAPSAYGSSYSSVGGGGGGGSMRRGKPARRPTLNGNASVSGRGGGGRPMSPYEEEEEGYVSGDYDDSQSQMPYFELSKIRVKLHYASDVRGMTMSPVLPWDEFRARVATKFGKRETELGMKFLDESDGGEVSLRDESDFELAVETAREMAKGRAEGKLEVWVVDE